MFKQHIEQSLESLRQELDFDAANFSEDPRFVLSQFDGASFVAYYSRDIELRVDIESCNGYFAYGFFDLVALVPPCYIAEAVIWNVFSHINAEITGISTDSRSIYKSIFGDELKSDYQLIRFSCRLGMPVMKLINCCLEMKQEC